MFGGIDTVIHGVSVSIQPQCRVLCSCTADIQARPIPIVQFLLHISDHVTVRRLAQIRAVENVCVTMGNGVVYRLGFVIFCALHRIQLSSVSAAQNLTVNIYLIFSGRHQSLFPKIRQISNSHDTTQLTTIQGQKKKNRITS